MSKFVEFKNVDDGKSYLNVDEITVVQQDGPERCWVYTRDGGFHTLNESFRTVKGRIIKANGNGEDV